MPPKKTQKKASLPFPPATSTFKYSTSFRPYQRDSPPQYNQIPIPVGKNGCLNGISFVVTGTLPSLKREQAKDLIEKYGGKMMSSISGKTDIVLRGVEEVGPKKIQEAESRGIQIIDQEGLFTFIENSLKSTPAPPPTATPPPTQAKEEPVPKSKTKKGADKKEADIEKELEAKRIEDILSNLQKPTSSFTYFQGFQYGTSLTDNPPQHNQIPIPVGAFGCLKGLVFVQTGTLQSLTKDETKDLIEKYGGTIAKSITKKTHILIRGCIDVGETKMRDAKAKKIPIIDQAGLFDIIQRSNTKNQQQQQQQEQKTPQKEDEFSSDFYQSSLFTEKYRPRSMKDVVGNIGAINQLRDWIKNFKPSSKKKESKDSVKPIALISGPAGVGKTTSAHLVCSELGFSITEFNSSESRAKKFIEEISASTSNMSFSFDDAKVIRNKKNVIIFEDIEDMSRSYSNLIELAEKSKIPIICICNDINDKKFEPLLKASLSIRFMQPKAEEIKKRLRFICNTEGIDISDENLNDIIAVSKHDVRFAINSIQYWCQWGEKAKESAVKDDVIDDIIDAVLTILTPTSKKDLNKKFDAFFFDYNQIPLYIEQNLPLPMKPGEGSIDKGKMKEYRHNYADALESICYGDLIDNCIQETQVYSLLNAQAVTSSIYPSECVEANVVSLSMPKLYGATKKQQKIQRYIQQIGQRTNTFSNQPKAEIYDTFSTLLNMKIGYLISKTKDYTELISFIDSLGLTPDDFNHVEELCSYDKKKSGKLDSIMKDIMKLYKKKHSDDPKKLSSETDFRALHNIWQSAGKAHSIK